MKDVKLVISGSGTMFPFQGGAVWALYDAGYRFSAVAGVSGGSIIAAALASGYKPGEELNELIIENMPSWRFWDVSWNPFKSWGLIKGKRGLKVLQRFFPGEFEHTQIPLKVYAVNIDSEYTYAQEKYTIFGTDETPLQSIADAVRASISIPGVFVPHVIDGDRYIDGGVAASFPLDVYGSGEDVIGIKMLSAGPQERPKTSSQYAGMILNVMMESVDQEHIDDAVWARTIKLKTSRPFFKLNTEPDEVEVMIQQGYAQTTMQLQKMGLM